MEDAAMPNEDLPRIPGPFPIDDGPDVKLRKMFAFKESELANGMPNVPGYVQVSHLNGPTPLVPRKFAELCMNPERFTKRHDYDEAANSRYGTDDVVLTEILINRGSPELNTVRQVLLNAESTMDELCTLLANIWHLDGDGVRCELWTRGENPRRLEGELTPLVHVYALERQRIYSCDMELKVFAPESVLAEWRREKRVELREQQQRERPEVQCPDISDPDVFAPFRRMLEQRRSERAAEIRRALMVAQEVEVVAGVSPEEARVGADPIVQAAHDDDGRDQRAREQGAQEDEQEEDHNEGEDQREEQGEDQGADAPEDHQDDGDASDGNQEDDQNDSDAPEEHQGDDEDDASEEEKAVAPNNDRKYGSNRKKKLIVRKKRNFPKDNDGYDASIGNDGYDASSEEDGDEQEDVHVPPEKVQQSYHFERLLNLDDSDSWEDDEEYDSPEETAPRDRTYVSERNCIRIFYQKPMKTSRKVRLLCLNLNKTKAEVEAMGMRSINKHIDELIADHKRRRELARIYRGGGPAIKPAREETPTSDGSADENPQPRRTPERGLDTSGRLKAVTETCTDDKAAAAVGSVEEETTAQADGVEPKKPKRKREFPWTNTEEQLDVFGRDSEQKAQEIQDREQPVLKASSALEIQSASEPLETTAPTENATSAQPEETFDDNQDDANAFGDIPTAEVLTSQIQGVFRGGLQELTPEREEQRESAPEPKTKRRRKVIEMSDELYTVEAILEQRRRRGKVEYYIKWLGYDHTHNTWEPEKNIVDPNLIANFKNSEKKRRELRKAKMERQKAAEAGKEAGASSSSAPAPTSASASASASTSAKPKAPVKAAVGRGRKQKSPPKRTRLAGGEIRPDSESDEEPEEKKQKKADEELSDEEEEDYEQPVQKKKRAVIEEDEDDVTEEVAEEVTEEVAEEVTEEVAEDVTEEVAEDVTVEVAEEVTEEVAEEVTEEVAEEDPEETQEETEQPTRKPVAAETKEADDDVQIVEEADEHPVAVAAVTDEPATAAADAPAAADAEPAAVAEEQEAVNGQGVAEQADQGVVAIEPITID